MELTEITARTKAAIRVWAQLDDLTPVLLDAELESFRKNALNDLRVKVNREFTGESGFPISSQDWLTLDPKTVRNVRDEVKKRVNA